MTNISTIRAFIAIEIPQNILAKLDQVRTNLEPLIDRKAVKWVATSNIHLTLRFLGETKVDSLQQLAAGMDAIAKEYSVFELALDTLGCFPNPRNPRVIWVGLRGEVGKLLDVQRKIEQMVISLGHTPDNKRFHPHLTLGRVKDSRIVVQSRLPWDQKIESPTFQVDSVSLIESKLQPSGAVYTTRHRSELADHQI